MSLRFGRSGMVKLRLNKTSPVLNAPQDKYQVARKRMVHEQLIKRGIQDARVIQAMLEVPRHLFVDEGILPMAHRDHPLPIGEGQTLSQPYIVALMLEKLRLQPQDKVLEIGMGCGYQTAVLSKLVHQVYSIERISSLFFKARSRLKNLGCRNVHLRLGDGSLGWAKYAPFDAIIVSAASPTLPQPYLSQLAEGGRLIIPVGSVEEQTLTFVEKKTGKISQEAISRCRFVKLKGSYGFSVL